MSAKAELKHHAALFSVAVGATGLLLAAITFWLGFEKGGAGFFGCAAVALIPGLLLVRGGLRMRNRAVAAGSTAHLEGYGSGNVRTSRTGTAKPSFLRDKKNPDE